jgi:magnesium-transporting ATPase (P-type)
MTAFLVVLVSGGWTYGAAADAALLATASGAAFTAVVLGQLANAFACRSGTRPAWRLDWRGNRLLLGAVAIEVLVLAAMLLAPPVADLLGMSSPPLLGLLVAAAAIPAVLAADGLHKGLAAVLRGRRAAVS